MSRGQVTRGHRQPPDYHSATQMAQVARQRHLIQHGRSHSYEGVLSGYYRTLDPNYGQHFNDDGKQKQLIYTPF